MSRPAPTDSFTYAVFGLSVRTDRPLAGVLPAPDSDRARPDVHIHFDSLPPWAPREREVPGEPWYVSPVSDAAGRPATTAWKLADGHLWLTFTARMDFFVNREGTEAWIVLPSAAAFGEAVAHVLGPILGLLLSLRGRTCLHASAVSVGDQTVAFAGLQGVGKSTLAAALAMRGCSVVSDDLVALFDRGEAVVAQPGYPRLSLRPQVVPALQEMSGGTLALTPDWDEHVSLDLVASGYMFQRQPAPLAAIYFLDEPSADGWSSAVETISGREALMRLVGDTWATRLLDPSMRAAELDLLSRLVAQARVRRLRLPFDLAQLSPLCDRIVGDVEARR